VLFTYAALESLRFRKAQQEAAEGDEPVENTD
jgi:hypothetical protein